MKNVLKKAICAATALSMAVPAFAVGVSVNGVPIDTDVQVIENRIYIPADKAAEVFGELVNVTDIDGQSYAPIRANSDHNGYGIEWVQETGMAEITIPAENEDYFDNRYFKVTVGGKTLGTQGASTENSALIVAGEVDNIWSLTAKGDGKYTFINKNSGKSIDMPASTKDEGREATQYTPNSGSNQTLVMEAQGDKYALKFEHSGLYLTVREDGVLTQESFTGEENQLFSFEYIGDNAMRGVRTSPGYLALSAEDRDRFDRYVYTSQAYTTSINSQTAALLESENYADKSAEEQAEILKKCFNFVAFNLVWIGEVPADPNTTVEVSNKTYIESYDVWRGTMEPVWRYDVTMSDGYSMQLYTTVEDCSVVEDAAHALARFPLAMRKYLKRLIHRMDDANNYNGGGDTIWIRLNYLPSENAIAQTLGHELGHVLDTTLTYDYSIWEEAIKADGLPISGYGNNNRTEDLAEYSRLFHMARRSDEVLAAVEAVYPNRAKAYRALLYAGDSEYYAQYKEDYEELSPYVKGEEEVYSIVSPTGSSLVLTAKAPEGEGNATLVLAEDQQLPSQRWWVRHKKDGSVVLFNQDTGYCANVPGENTAPGVQLITWNGGGGNNETFIVTENADGTLSLKVKHSDLYLSIDGSSVVQSETETKWIVK